MTTAPVRDFDFHPDEDGVRVFTTAAGGVLRFDDDSYVTAGRYGEVILWHYAFAGHWFKVNLTTDLVGRIVDTGADEPARRFAFNCDLATPMRRGNHAVHAVDLFLDVLVAADGVTYRVTDLDEFERACRLGVVLPGEARGARRGLAQLTSIIERHELLDLLSDTCPVGPLDPPPASAPTHVPLAQVPLLSEESRSLWAQLGLPPARPLRGSGRLGEG